MTHRFADLAFAPNVRAAQEHDRSRGHNARLQINFDPNDQLGPKETEFIKERDALYVTTTGESGWPEEPFCIR